MAAGSVAAGWPGSLGMGLMRSCSQPHRCVFLLVVIVGGISGGQSSSESSVLFVRQSRSRTSRGDYLALYEQAATRYGVDWAVLAAIGKIEYTTMGAARQPDAIHPAP